VKNFSIQSSWPENCPW